MGNKSFVFRFADVEVREREFTLIKAGKVLTVEPKAFRTLLFLLHNPQRLISKEELLNSVWGDAAVTEGSLTRCIWLLRRLLEDDIHEPRYIETVATVGYRFVCPVEVLEVGGYDTGGTVAQASATPETPATGETKEKIDQPSKGTRWKSKKWFLPGLGFATLLILTVGFLGAKYKALSLHRPSFVKAKNGPGRERTVSLTNVRGFVQSPIFSPDGKQIAFLWNGKDQNKSDIYVQMIGGEQPLRLTYSGIRNICCLDWSPNGQWISFARWDGDVGGVFIIPALGGPERKLADVTSMEAYLSNPAWTLDGKALLLGDRCVPDGPYGIVMFSLATGQKHCLSAPLSNNGMDYDLNLSPDGGTVAFVRSNNTAGAGEIYVVPLEGGTARQLTSDGNGIGNIMWTADGKRIIFNGYRGGYIDDRLWQVSIEGGEIEPETVYPHIGALSRDGQRIAYQTDAGGEPPSIWRAELSGPGGQVLARKKVVTSPIGDDSPQLSPDGTKIAFASARSGNMEIWRSDADGSNPLQLTSFGGDLDGTPRWSPDGKWIVFDRRPAKHSQIYVVDTEGRNLRALTDGEYENSVPSFSRDGKSIYFGSMRRGSWQLWKQNFAGGEPVQMTQHGGFTAFESYDGKTLYYTKKEKEGIWSIPMSDGAETRVTAAPRRGFWGHWAVCETGLYLLDNDILPRPTIEFYSFKTRKLTPVIRLEKSPHEWNPSLDASRDGRIVLFVEQQEQTALAMVENFQ
jgi:Tol biopolymer transport system component/DNA-binding winged helix-turn-helix (wHTH) protein